MWIILWPISCIFDDGWLGRSTSIHMYEGKLLLQEKMTNDSPAGVPLPSLVSATIQDRFVTRPFSRNSSSRNGGRCRQFLIVLKGAGWPGWEEPDLETPWIQSKGFCQLHSFPVTHTSLQVSKTDAAASSEYYLEFACWASSGVCSALLLDAARTQKVAEKRRKDLLGVWLGLCP